MSKTKKASLTAIFIAMYFVLSAMLKIPVGGHITLDLGYIALAVGAAYLGTFPAMLIGAGGALLESALMSQRGVSPGWILMNAIIGVSCGYVMSRAFLRDKRKFIRSSCAVILLSVLLGASVKTVVDCALYQLSYAVKIPTGIAAFAADSIVMIFGGVPLCLALKKRI